MLEVLRQPQVQRAGTAVVPAQVKVQARAAQSVQRALDQCFEINAHPRAVECLRGANGANGEWVHIHFRAGAVFAGDAVYGLGKQARALRDAVRLAEGLFVWCELDDRGAG
ncbi:hypothetical protein D3C76_1525290 [compost metagenome]